MMKALLVAVAVAWSTKAATVVTIDLSRTAASVSENATGAWHAIRVGDRGFLCSTGPHTPRTPAALDSQWPQDRFSWSMRSQTIRSIADSKTISLWDGCFSIPAPASIADTFDVCVNRHVVANRLATHERKLIGMWQRQDDAVYANGTLTQTFRDTRSKRNSQDLPYMAHVEYECSLERHPAVTQVSVDSAGKLYFRVIGPTFCDWSQRWVPGEGWLPNHATAEPSVLLSPLEKGCLTLSEKSTEVFSFCWPEKLTRTVDNEKTVLGALILALPTDTWLDGLASKTTAEQRIQYPTLHTELVDVPPTIEDVQFGAANILGTTQQALKLTLPHGERCKDGRSSAEVYFICPRDWPRMSESKLFHVRQRGACSWEAIVAVPAICAHPLLLPLPDFTHTGVLCWPTELDRTVAEPQPIEYPGVPFTKQNIAMRHSTESVWHDDQIPEDNLTTTSVEPTGFFASGLYMRNPSSCPYALGQVVRHKKFHVNAVVIGWDPLCRAPGPWRSAFQSMRPGVSLSQPCLRLLPDNGTDITLYTPASLVESTEPHTSIRNENLGKYFSGWNGTHYVPLNTVEMYYLIRSRTILEQESMRQISPSLDNVIGPENGAAMNVPTGVADSTEKGQNNTINPANVINDDTLGEILHL